MTQAAIAQFRVVVALMLRDTLSRYGNTQLGYIWAIVEPMMFVAVLSVAFSVIGAEAPFGNSKPLFFATGILSFFIYRKLAGGLTFKTTRALMIYPQVKPIDGALARALLETATIIVAMIIIFAAMVYGFEVKPPRNILVIMAAIGGLFLLGFGFGLINAVVSEIFPAWQQLMNVLNRPMLFISGILFVPEQLPQKILYYLSWNPLLHGISWFRHGYYTNYPTSVLDIQYLLVWGLGLCLVGFSAERVLRRHVETEN